MFIYKDLLFTTEKLILVVENEFITILRFFDGHFGFFSMTSSSNKFKNGLDGFGDLQNIGLDTKNISLE